MYKPFRESEERRREGSVGRHFVNNVSLCVSFQVNSYLKCAIQEAIHIQLVLTYVSVKKQKLVRFYAHLAGE